MGIYLPYLGILSPYMGIYLFLQVLTYLLNYILESEELAFYYEELASQKHEIW